MAEALLANHLTVLLPSLYCPANMSLSYSKSPRAPIIRLLLAFILLCTFARLSTYTFAKGIILLELILQLRSLRLCQNYDLKTTDLRFVHICLLCSGSRLPSQVKPVSHRPSCIFSIALCCFLLCSHALCHEGLYSCWLYYSSLTSFCLPPLLLPFLVLFLCFTILPSFPQFD